MGGSCGVDVHDARVSLLGGKGMEWTVGLGGANFCCIVRLPLFNYNPAAGLSLLQGNDDDNDDEDEDDGERTMTAMTERKKWARGEAQYDDQSPDREDQLR